MEAVAEATGGVAYYNSNDLADLTRQGYERRVGLLHALLYAAGKRVRRAAPLHQNRCSKPGLKLTYRDEYYAEDPRTMSPTPGLTLAEVPDAKGPVDMRKEMTRAMPTSQQLLFDVQVEPSRRASEAGRSGGVRCAGREAEDQAADAVWLPVRASGTADCVYDCGGRYAAWIAGVRPGGV